MEDLVMYGTPAEGVYTTSEIVAKYTDVSVEHVRHLTNKYHDELGKFGKLVFKNSSLPSGQTRKVWHYNEQQATFLIALMRNTDTVVEFKRNLVAAFYSQREELAHKTIALANIKPVNKSLSEVVHDSWPDNPHMYATIHNLALKVVTGKNAKQLKAEFGVSDAKDALTAEQVSDLEHVREDIKALLLIGKSYEEVKEALA
ncbi:prophage ps3 protein 13 [Weissella confusa]|uniref:Rha family transcriptional regulator n=1 Tax=Weissella confusa TaxID=1583 RepID=UPI0022FE917A|nr:Rha family transcriptional regulator [Weissella confusa]MDA5459782.1 prophage ps3 protein 13 [Weissella confusa]